MHCQFFHRSIPRCCHSTRWTIRCQRSPVPTYMQQWQSKRLQSSSTATNQSAEQTVEYHGPLAPTFRRLKLFSVSSLGLSVTLAPFMFVIESNLPTFARAALCATALGTSGISTALVAWCGSPYVTTLKRLPPQGMELTTLTLTLKPRVTTVYDINFLVETKRAFAKWELAESITLPTTEIDSSSLKDHGREETVAETRDREGKVVGRWIVAWDENGKGSCREVGKVVRHFNVHEELL